MIKLAINSLVYGESIALIENNDVDKNMRTNLLILTLFINLLSWPYFLVRMDISIDTRIFKITKIIPVKFLTY